MPSTLSPRVPGWVALLSIALLLAGCSRMAVVHTNTPAELNLPIEALPYIQLYLGDTVTLEHTSVRARSAITRSRAVVNEVQDYERVILIQRKTPGLAEVVRPDEVQVRFAEDIVLGFRPDLGALPEALRDSLGLPADEPGRPPAEALPPDSLALPAEVLARIEVPLPYRLVSFNGQPLLEDSLVTYRGLTYTVRFGYEARSGDFIERPRPPLLYVRNLDRQRVRDVVKVQGIRLGS